MRQVSAARSTIALPLREAAPAPRVPGGLVGEPAHGGVDQLLQQPLEPRRRGWPPALVVLARRRSRAARPRAVTSPTSSSMVPGAVGVGLGRLDPRGLDRRAARRRPARPRTCHRCRDQLAPSSRPWQPQPTISALATASCARARLGLRARPVRGAGRGFFGGRSFFRPPSSSSMASGSGFCAKGPVPRARTAWSSAAWRMDVGLGDLLRRRARRSTRSGRRSSAARRRSRSGPRPRASGSASSRAGRRRCGPGMPAPARP